MGKRYLSIAALIIAFGLFALRQYASPAAFSTASSIATANRASTGTALYRVTRVVDGDTIEIEKDGKHTKIRLIGIDTPEVVDPRRPVQCFGREASRKAHDLLNGRQVAIETDPSQDTYDKYGRLLAYVFLPDGTLVNKYMIAQGYAHEYTYRFPYKYQDAFKTAERAARSAHKGLWAPETCNGDTKQAATSYWRNAAWSVFTTSLSAPVALDDAGI